MKYVAIIGALIALLAVIIAGPILTIASLNTLFGLNIAYTVVERTCSMNFLSMK